MPITLKNVTKSFDSVRVLDLPALEIPDTGIFAILGASGNGKTTLLRILAALETPDSGSVEGLDGKKISVVFQEDRLLPTLTALQNVAIVSNEKNAKDALCAVGLSDAADKLPSQLSGGMARRVALARAIAYGGDVYLLDEPFKGLDSEIKNQVVSLFVKLAEKASVIIVTHDEQEAALAAKSVHL